MLFYRVEVKTANLSEASDRREQIDRTAAIQLKIQELFDKSKHSCHISVSSIDYNKQKMTLCAALKNETLSEKAVTSFLNTVDLPYKQVNTSSEADVQSKSFEIQEITLDAYFNLLYTSSRNNFIPDEDDVFEKLCLDELSPRRHRSTYYSETLVCDGATKKELLNKSAELPCYASLSAEIERIYHSRKGKKIPVGHPVHYCLQSDNRESRNKALQILLTALFQNRRIAGRRYCKVNLDGFEDSPEKKLNALYESCSGETIVIPIYKDILNQGRYADTRMSLIATICALMKKYRNSVLTVFCLPREDNVKDAILEQLGAMTIVLIREEAVFEDRAKTFLHSLARQYHVKPTPSLYHPIISGKGYSSADLNLIFDEWYDHRLKTDVYPQYAGLQAANKQVVGEKPKGSAYEELTHMIGLKEVKSVIRQALDFYKAQKLFKNKGLCDKHPAMHMVFTGNPGTAKTTVARLFAQIMKDNDLLSVGDLYEVGRADLVGKYVGWTAQIVKQKFKAAKGSVLFIDEAYALAEDRDGLYGDEAINTIVQEMENNREDMIVIFAGYPNEMEKFLQKNPGLRSRIAFQVPFSDYSAEELFEIIKLMAYDKNITLANGAKEKLIPIFEAAMREADFGNGRFARNLFEKARMRQASRLVAMDVDAVTKADVETLIADDFEIPAVRNPAAVRKIGFAS